MSTKSSSKRGRSARGGRSKGKPAGPSSIRRETRDLFVPHDQIPPRSPELKHIDYASSGYITTGLTYAGAVTSVAPVAQGVAGNQRIGDAIRVRGVELRVAGYEQGTSEMMRTILFRWNNNSVPTPSLVLQGVGVTSQTIAAPYNFQSCEQGFLDILDDKVHMACVNGGPGAFHHVARMEKPMQVTFDTGATTGSGLIYILIISDAALAANSPAYQVWIRTLFEDV